jgi:hypothetical protein
VADVGVLILISWASVSTTFPGLGKFLTTSHIGTAAAKRSWYSEVISIVR